ncbi:MAG: Asp-tRNA(Asn)/Glu-tRNA(Gln) amidotransferase subunit GatB [archaeon]
MAADMKVMIGLEIHAYLGTKSKLFCSCPTEGTDPNTACCPICLGHPGSKPVLNRKAVDYGVKIGFMLNCGINKDFFFSRKTYFYPDMAMNYQITQYEVPLAQYGFVELAGGKKIKIRRAHLEWDPAALVHPDGMGKSSYCLIDYNRSDSPLIEIVTEPDIASPAEAREFLKTLENMLGYLGVLKQGTTLKVDCNVSILGGNRTEIKNVSGFAAAETALTYEIARQTKEVSSGNKIEQHTRAYNADTGTTIALRSKETESDYGYIFDPDLVKVSLSDTELSKIKSEMPELPDVKAKRYLREYNLAEYDAKVICGDFELSKIFDSVVAKGAKADIAAKLLTRELLAILNHDSLSLLEVKNNIKTEYLVELLKLIAEGKVSDKNSKASMINYISGGHLTPAEYLKKNNLLISQTVDLETIIAKVIAANEKAVIDYKGGNEKTFNFLAGLVMRETKGTASPQKVQDALKSRLSK